MQSDEKLALYLAGLMPDPERLGFEMELLADPESRRELLGQQRVSAGLEALLAKDGDRMAAAILASARGKRQAAAVRDIVRKPAKPRWPMPKIVRGRRRPVAARGIARKKTSPLWPVLAVAASVVFLAFVYRMLVPHETARVIREVAAVWEGTGPVAGETLHADVLKLQAGVAELEFLQGAKVVLEGPAELRLISEKEAFLQHGRLRAVVPPRAHGFTIRGEGFSAVDLGTEFGVIAGDAPEVHVFTGKVDLHTGSDAPVGLSANQAMRVDRGLATSVAAQPLAFVSESELARRELRAKGDYLGAWRMAGRQLDENPATVLHLDFETAPDGMMPNLARRASAASDAGVFGCKPAEGRWPGKRALKFEAPADRLEFALPGQFESLTLMAWVRVDSLHGWGNPLISGYGSRAGEVNWYIHRDGSPRLDVHRLRETDAGEHSHHTHPVVGEGNFGSWGFVACVLDGANQIVTQYFNGKKLGSKVDFVRVPFQLATAEIGNTRERPWRTAGDPPSNFEGSIDEVAILSTALTSDDIARLYQQGKPGHD